LLIVGVLLTFLNVQSLRAGEGSELTTSAALVLTGYLGILCGLGHVITPSAIAVVAAGLLTWKERLAGFSQKITASELRSAILLAILTFAIYPVLPDRFVDPWNVIAPRAAWLTVLLIAAIGFVNYVLFKFFGTRGVELTGFLGGLVNSTITVAELANRARSPDARMRDGAYRGVLLSTAAMALRNALLLCVLSFKALLGSIIPLLLMLALSTGLGLRGKRAESEGEGAGPQLPLQSPFSLTSALKYGLVFLILQVAGTIAQRALGRFGFFAVSTVGGFVSSASAVASAASLAAHGVLAPGVAGIGAVLASLASAAVHVVIIYRVAGQVPGARRLSWSLAGILLLGAAGALVQERLGILAW